LADSELNRYPNPSAIELQQTLRELMGIPNEFGVLLGNGSDELIQLLALACDTGAGKGNGDSIASSLIILSDAGT
jgi:histidinol-phosphate aminotransferase